MAMFDYKSIDFNIIAYDSEHLMMYGDFGARAYDIEINGGYTHTIIFGVDENKALIVKQLVLVGQTRDTIDGVQATYDERCSIFNLRKPVRYSGNIFVGNDATFLAPFLKLAPPQDEISCFELQFENSKLIDAIDYSSFVQEQVEKYPDFPEEFWSFPQDVPFQEHLKKRMKYRFKFMPREYRFIDSFLPGGGTYRKYYDYDEL